MSDRADGVASYDLHLHTCWSYDATASVESHFRRARELGVRCIAITDHHVLDSLPEVMDISRRYPEVRVIPAGEFTVTVFSRSIDMVCYGFSAEISSELRQALAVQHEWQRACGAAISEGLSALGCEFTEADRLALLETYRPPRTIAVQGVTHVKGQILRAYCIERGFVDTEEAYNDMMARARERVAIPPYPSAEDVIPVLKRAGALVGIAHPHKYFNQGDRSRMDALREELQFEGIECAHGSVPPEYARIYREYCVEHGLFSVGGSDCHSEEDVQTVFARHGGPDEWLDEFLAALDAR